jgi:ParB-like chromosome segregation protein Spo0J
MENKTKEERVEAKSNFMDTSTHPVSNVLWVDNNLVVANDYNPNKVAPPEMRLLELSISSDGYTQPIVTWQREDGMYEVVDGFHRHLVGKKLGLSVLPIVVINKERQDKSDRISSTIRHNRARGKHVIQAMSDIVIELKNRNWKNERIARELGMEEDEVLRLCQITGLASLFKDEEFSKSCDIKDSVADEIPQTLDDAIDQDEKERYGFRTVNTSDENRVFHTFDKWECHKAGFYNSSHAKWSKDECEKKYAEFLSDDKLFRKALGRVIKEWKYSCEHYLTNASMNRIAWLGQASVCIELGISSDFRAGYHLLAEEQQEKANKTALEYLNKWLKANKMEQVTLEQAMPDRQATIY